MRKGIILLAAFFAVAMTTTTADAARKKAAKVKADPAVAASQRSAMFVTDAFQPWQPQRAMPKARKGKKKKR